MKVLIAKLLVGELARALGLRVPELVLADLDAAFGRSEADEEIQDLLRASTGQNLALHYLALTWPGPPRSTPWWRTWPRSWLRWSCGSTH